MLVWFSGPPLTLLFTSEGVSLRLHSAKRYQKPFRGSHQGTTLTQYSQDRITLLAHLVLLGTLRKGWLPQLVFCPDKSLQAANFINIYNTTQHNSSTTSKSLASVIHNRNFPGHENNFLIFFMFLLPN